MKVTLMRPPFNFSRYEPPLGIASIAAYLETKGHEVSIIDCEVLRLDTDEKVLEAIKEESPDVVGISFFTYDRFSAIRVSELAKSIGAVVVVGGIHVTSVPKETLEAVPTFDYGIIGEGELTFAELLERLDSKEDVSDMDGIVFRDGERVVVKPRRAAIEDLSTLPHPAYHLLPMDLYPFHAVMGSRGCPFDCVFCASPDFWQRRVRYATPKYVVDEIELLMRDYGRKYLHFKDDNFMVNRQWGIDICDEIIARGLNIKWDCLGRVDCVDEAILNKAKAAGADRIRYGIESGNERVLDVIKKGIKKDDARKAVALAKKIGFKRIGTLFVIGHPTETTEDLQETFDFSMELRAEHVSFKPLDVYPGAEIYKIAVKNKVLPKDFDWFERGRYKAGFMTYDDVPSYESEYFTRDKLNELSREFYLMSFLKRVFSMRSMRDFHYITDNEYGIRSFSGKEVRYFLKHFFEEFRKADSWVKRFVGVSMVSFAFIRSLYLLARKFFVRYEVGEN